MKKIRVLYTIPNFDTAGSGRALLNIAHGLDKNRFEPLVMCKHDNGAFFEVVKSSGIPVYIFDYTTEMKPYYRGILGSWKISREFRRIKPDIIHSFHYSADYSEAMASKMAGVRWVYTKKNMNWAGSSSNSWKLRSFLATGIVAQNTDMLRDFFPNNKKVFLIPRGVNVRKFSFDPVLHDFRSMYGILPTENLIITVANLVPVKGIEVLMEAFKKLSDQITGWSLIIVGDDRNEYADHLKMLCRKWSIVDRVIFTGKVADVKGHLQMAKIFVLPTLNKGEGSPLALIEAMANSRCVIGSAVPGIKDQLASYPDNLFDPGNIGQLSDKLLQLIRMSDENRKIMGHMFYLHATNNYNIEKEVKLHEEMYFQLL